MGWRELETPADYTSGQGTTLPGAEMRGRRSGHQGGHCPERAARTEVSGTESGHAGEVSGKGHSEEKSGEIVKDECHGEAAVGAQCGRVDTGLGSGSRLALWNWKHCVQHVYFFP